MKKKIKWVCELPHEIQNEIRNEAIEIMLEFTDYNWETIIYEVDNNIMNEKLINIIGYEDGLLDANKYAKYIFEGVEI